MWKDFFFSLHIMEFSGNQMVQGPKVSVQTANCSKGFKRFQIMIKSLI